MKKIWILAGRITYILAWPALYFYLKNSQRSRVIVRVDNKVLVLKDWLGEDKWKLPGGGIHNHEAAVTSAQRELREETSISVETNQLISHGSLETKSHGASIKFHIFSCQLPVQPNLKLQKLEIIDSRWLSLKEVAKAQLSADTEVILKKYSQL